MKTNIKTKLNIDPEPSHLFCSVNGQEKEVEATATRNDAYKDWKHLKLIADKKLKIYDRHGYSFEAFAYELISKNEN